MKPSAHRKNLRGIAMTEYLIILGIVAIAAIAIVGLFGQQIKSVFTRSNGALTGQALSANTSAVSASQSAATADNMGTFDKAASATAAGQ